MWAYKNSTLLRYAEEAIAEGYATKSITKSLAFPFTGYNISPLRLGVEGAVFGGLVFGSTIYALTRK
jgi:hypothetical protein